MTVGQEIRRRREEKGWSQAKLGVLSGTGPSGISQIETGRRNPSAATLGRIAEALEVEIGDLFPKGQESLPLEVPAALEASDEDFAQMVAEADDEQLAAMKRALKEYLPKGGPVPAEIPRPTQEQLLAMNRCIAIHQKQKDRIEDDDARFEELAAAVSA